jgi:hypothetical protein
MQKLKKRTIPEILLAILCFDFNATEKQSINILRLWYTFIDLWRNSFVYDKSERRRKDI